MKKAEIRDVRGTIDRFGKERARSTFFNGGHDQTDADCDRCGSKGNKKALTTTTTLEQVEDALELDNI